MLLVLKLNYPCNQTFPSKTFICNLHNSSFTEPYLLHVYQCHRDIPSNHHHHSAATVIYTYKRKKDVSTSLSHARFCSWALSNQGERASELWQCIWFPTEELCLVTALTTAVSILIQNPMCLRNLRTAILCCLCTPDLPKYQIITRFLF